jgi:hypothetical protein
VAFVAMLTTHPCTGGTRASVRCTTWNLQWFPNGSARDASAEEQNRRIADAASVLKPLRPDILLLQEVRDYAVCSRLGDAIELADITWKFAHHSRSRFKAAGVGSKWQSFQDLTRKQLGRNNGNLWRELTHREALRLRGSRFEMEIVRRFFQHRHTN